MYKLLILKLFRGVESNFPWSFFGCLFGENNLEGYLLDRALQVCATLCGRASNSHNAIVCTKAINVLFLAADNANQINCLILLKLRNLESVARDHVLCYFFGPVGSLECQGRC